MNVGVHPTPAEITNQFALATVGFWQACQSAAGAAPQVRVCDLFCGDGRLGRAVSETLEGGGTRVDASFVDVDHSRFGSLFDVCRNVVRANAFKWTPHEPFDLIVCNPPYQSLTAAQAQAFGISWDTARLGGRNLYSVSILRALELCRPGGLVGVVAPFGWLRGIRAREFRAQVAGLCSKVVVIASRERDRFGGPRQDTAFQYFYRRTGTSSGPAACTFSYEHVGESVALDLLAPNKVVGRQAGWRVRVGPLVWNRNLSALTRHKHDAHVLVYGGNIRNGLPLDLSVPRYEEKQYVSRSAIPQDYLTQGPAILFRRTLRGHPGEWHVDSVALEHDFVCVAENHVICVELPGLKGSLRSLQEQIVNDVRAHYRLSGSPNISCQTMRQLVSRRIGERQCKASSA